MKTETEIKEYIQAIRNSIELMEKIGGFSPRTFRAFESALVWVLDEEE